MTTLNVTDGTGNSPRYQAERKELTHDELR